MKKNIRRIVLLPPLLKVPEHYRDQYLKHRVRQNSERLVSIAAFIGIIMAVLLIQHLISPGLARDSLLYFSYLFVYGTFFIGSLAYLIFGLVKPVLVGRVIQLAYLFLVFSCAVFLNVLDRFESNDLTAYILVVIVMAIIYRSPTYFFLTWLLFFDALLISICIFLFGFVFFKSFLVSIFVANFCSLLMSYLFNYYDIRSFLLQRTVEVSLKEKETILKEVHHRIKNNMNTIIGTFTLQAERLTDPSAISALEEAENRVRSMMMLYDKLYLNNAYEVLSVPEYLVILIDEIIENFPNKDRISITKKIDDVDLDTWRLQPLGILLNELITNAMKYAFRDRDQGNITIDFHQEAQDFILAVGDDGVGIPQSVTIGSSSGFGLELVSLLAQQLKGKVSVERNNGTRFVLVFPKQKK